MKMRLLQQVLHVLFITTYRLKKWLGAGLSFIMGFLIETICGFQPGMVSSIAIIISGIVLGMIVQVAAFFVGKAFCTPQYLCIMFVVGYFVAHAFSNTLLVAPTFQLLVRTLLAFLCFGFATYFGIAFGRYTVSGVARRKALQRRSISG
jgi:hypothetical protein